MKPTYRIIEQSDADGQPITSVQLIIGSGHLESTFTFPSLDGIKWLDGNYFTKDFSLQWGGNRRVFVVEYHPDTLTSRTEIAFNAEEWYELAQILQEWESIFKQ